MSTAQDHSRIAAELTDVFGPGAGESGALGNRGGSGEQGMAGTEAGRTILELASGVAQVVSGDRLTRANEGLVNAMNNPTIEGLTSAIGKGEEVQKAAAATNTAADVVNYSGMATAAGDLLTTGNTGTLGSNVVNVAKGNTGGIVPGLELVEKILPGNFRPIATASDFLTGAIDKVPGAGGVNRALDSFGNFVQELPGAGRTGRILSTVGDIPGNMIGGIPAGIIGSFRNADRVEASGRDAALTQLFTQEGSDGRLYISPPTSNEEVTGVNLRGNVNSAGVGSYSGRYNFPADEGQTRQQLFEEFQNSDTYRGLINEQRGLQSLATQAKEDAAEAKEREEAISELTDPVQNVVPVATHADLGIGTHYSDEYGTYDVETGEKLDVPSIYEPATPILAPISSEAPAAPEAEYQAPRQPKAVEIAPMSRSDGSVSLDGGLTWSQGQSPMPRIRPEELVTPEKSLEQKIHEYRMAQNSRYQSLSASPSRSMAHAIDLTGLQKPASPRPKHNLRELPTGLNASSY